MELLRTNTKYTLALISILLISFSVRIIYFLLTDGITRSPIEDSADYHNHALNLSKEGAYYVINEFGLKVYSSRPPFLPFIISTFYMFSDDTNLLLARIFQSLVSVATIFLAYIFSRKFGLSRKFSLLVIIILCFYPPSIFYSSRVLTENLAALMLISGVLSLCIYINNKNNSYLFLAALFFTFLTLTRSSYLLLPFFILFSLIIRGFISKTRELSFKELIIFSLTALLLLAPWTIRNYQIHEEIMPTTSRFGVGLYITNGDLSDPEVQLGGYSRKSSLFFDRSIQLSDEVTQSDLYVQAAIKEILDNPKLFLSAAGQRFLNTFTWRPNPIARQKWVTSDYIMFIIWVPILLFFLMSITKLSNIYVFLTWISLLYIAGISFFFWGITRFRYPIDPLIIIFSVSSVSNIYYRILAKIPKLSDK